MLQKILTKKKIIFMGPGNVMEKSWNFVLEKLYEPCHSSRSNKFKIGQGQIDIGRIHINISHGQVRAVLGRVLC